MELIGIEDWFGTMDQRKKEQVIPSFLIVQMVECDAIH